jgi:single-stranded DNA-binding protein
MLAPGMAIEHLFQWVARDRAIQRKRPAAGTNADIAVTNLRMAVTQRIQQDGQWRDGDTSFFKVNVWRGQVEHLADYLTKGDRVMVTGRLRQRFLGDP